MEFVIVPLVALLAAGLTLFSGFGLGTILLPAFALFFPVPVAVALTAVVHLLNNLWKLLLLGRHADRQVVLEFGLPALLGAFAGAALLMSLADLEPLFRHQIAGRLCEVTAIKLLLAALMACFAVLEVLPSFSRLSVDRRYLAFGGMLSGFLGGLSGHQGALRSVFLLRCSLGKEAFLASGVVIACLVDLARLGVYGSSFAWAELEQNQGLLLVAVLAAFAGAFFGARLVRKVTMRFVQLVVSSMLLLIAVLLGTGLV